MGGVWGRRLPMAGLVRRFLVAVVMSALGLCLVPISAAAAVTTLTGTLSDGATYKIEVPGNWNHTLLLYSHGYVVPGDPNPARDVGDPASGPFIRSQGYAVGGSSYAHTGWAFQEAIPDQIATLDIFNTQVGTQSRSIAWGHSLGGIITAGLLQTHPDRFDAALPMCGVVAGGVAVWNEGLDAEFVIKQLLAPSSTLQLVHITDPNNLGVAEGILFQANSTPAGKARIALAAAVGDLPGWFTAGSPEPSSTDFATQEANQFKWLTRVDGPFVFALRGQLELRAGANPSWSAGVNYAKQLGNSIDNAEVQPLYQQAGLSLDADLASLAGAARISADSAAGDLPTHTIAFTGEPHAQPGRTIHPTPAATP